MDQQSNFNNEPPVNYVIPTPKKSGVSDFLKDDVGEFSLMRLMTALGCFVFFGMWVMACFGIVNFIHFTWEDVAVISALIGGKAIQSKLENNTTPYYTNRSTGMVNTISDLTNQTRSKYSDK